jgi:hypothetical protein
MSSPAEMRAKHSEQVIQLLAGSSQTCHNQQQEDAHNLEEILQINFKYLRKTGSSQSQPLSSILYLPHDQHPALLPQVSEKTKLYKVG